jgi:hypothetical protein
VFSYCLLGDLPTRRSVYSFLRHFSILTLEQMYFDNDSEKKGIFFRNSLKYELYCVISGIQVSYPDGRLLSGKGSHQRNVTYFNKRL